MIAIDWGWSIEATAARLMEESRKAQENGETYAARTVANAAAAVARARRDDAAPEIRYRRQSRDETRAGHGRRRLMVTN